MDCSAPPCKRRQGHLHLVTAADVGLPVACSSHPGLGRLLLQAGPMYRCAFLPQTAPCLPHSQHGWPSPGIIAPLSPTSEHTLDSLRLQEGDPRKPLCCSVWIICLGRYRALSTQSVCLQHPRSFSVPWATAQPLYCLHSMTLMIHPWGGLTGVYPCPLAAT